MAPSLHIVFMTCSPKLIVIIVASHYGTRMFHSIKHHLSLDEIISSGKCIREQVRSITAALVSQGQFP